VRALAGLIVAQLVASGAALAARADTGTSHALVRSVPPVPTTATTLPETTTAPPTLPPPTAPPTTARPPAPPSPTDAAGRLAARLDGALGNNPRCLVVHEGPNTVYARSPNTTYAPASTQKLLAAAAALDQLGPDFRFVTTVMAPAAPQDGTVDSLWLVGGGDPMLATPEYVGHVLGEPRTAGAPLTPIGVLADAVAGAGVRSVRGGLHGDDTRYNGPRWLPGWKPIYRDEADISPLSALTVDGGLDRWDPAEVVTADPTALATAQLSRLLAARGVNAAPGAAQAHPAGSMTIARVTSAPLSQIVAAMLRSSDNLADELIVRELDRHAGGTGTTAGGLQVVAATARRLGITTTGLAQTDGSGLDPGDRVSCATLLGAMEVGDRPGFSAITDGLAVAGRSGTLVHRFGGTPLVGTLAAKTGWINCAAGMVGRLTLHAPLRFALLVNGPCNYNAAEAIENHVAQALGTYPE
jgi:D-alanyl-D-alanine carboxypeptidase/D-alanyl-D-alanine-endopeptidase (penicillin-binding protein 4)